MKGNSRTIESKHEILKCNHSKESYWAVFLFIRYKVVHTYDALRWKTNLASTPLKQIVKIYIPIKQIMEKNWLSYCLLRWLCSINLSWSSSKVWRVTTFKRAEFSCGTVCYTDGWKISSAQWKFWPWNSRTLTKMDFLWALFPRNKTQPDPTISSTQDVEDAKQTSQMNFPR